ncbi:MAG TPA: hypothetical protein VJP40_01920, partial [bacterium]|nr:hypothetical protein [bacterium]
MSSPRRKISWLLTGLALVGLMVYLARSGHKSAEPRWDQRLAMAVVGPVSAFAGAASRRVGVFFRHWAELRGAQRDNVELRSESERLKSELIQ